jgi:5-methylcytosine-specific restriction endonuclease McrA
LLITTQCVTCADTFSYERGAAGRPRKTCSDACRKKRTDRRIETTNCRKCGNPYRSRYGGAGYCSLSCVRKWPSEKEANRAHEHRRRARLKQAFVEDVSERDIFERDNWRCGICGHKINKSLPTGHKMAASLDHIVPIARGGKHAEYNLQASHWVCNSRKSAFGKGDQLRLELRCL